MRGFNSKLSRLDKSISPPARITLTAALSNGELVEGITIGDPLPVGAVSVMAVRAGQVLAGWLPVGAWLAL